MLENIDICYKVAADLGYGVERMEDIILVTGCHLAKSWVSAAFSDSRGSSEVSFGVRMSRYSGVHFDERNVNGRGLKLGPNGEVGFARSLALTDFGSDTLRAESPPEPMHLRSRIPSHPHPQHMAQAPWSRTRSRFR